MNINFYLPTDKNGFLYKELYKEFHNTYPNIEIDQIVDDYSYDNGLDSCFTLDAIEHEKQQENYLKVWWMVYWRNMNYFQRI